MNSHEHGQQDARNPQGIHRLGWRRWQEERRKAYPSEANVAARRAEAAERRARGELDPAREASRLRLREVIARQRDLGLLREAGTADLLAEAGLADIRGRGGRQPGALQAPLDCVCAM